ncbi:hypothetical protein JG688_00008230 [Phytophthora aleatoria]|nr:hypothetical protein JG688_00008230 [Phytophthora aleatoria]
MSKRRLPSQLRHDGDDDRFHKPPSKALLPSHKLQCFSVACLDMPRLEFGDKIVLPPRWSITFYMTVVLPSLSPPNPQQLIKKKQINMNLQAQKTPKNLIAKKSPDRFLLKDVCDAKTHYAIMFEARLPQGRIVKLIVEAMKDLISEGNIDCTKSGLALQSMDGSHVSLVSLLLRAEGFEHYRCDRNISLGVQTASLSKILKCSGNDDALSLSAEDNGDALNIMFEATSGDRVSDFSLKLMDIDSEHLGIPGTEYVATVRMPAGEFQRICRDLQTMGDTCTIAVGKEGVKFSVSGDLGAGNITLKNNTAAEKESDRVIITMEEPVELTFALRYLNMFAKATPLSETVTLSMSPGIPVVVEYAIGDMGYMRFYLAPKVEEDD